MSFIACALLAPSEGVASHRHSCCHLYVRTHHQTHRPPAGGLVRCQRMGHAAG